LHPTNTFFDHLDILEDALGARERDRFYNDLTHALNALKTDDWDQNEVAAKIAPHGSSGRDFSYPINNEFLLVFRRDTDRVEDKPVRIHLFLKTVERISR
jgi:hypothetical protein